MSLLGLQTQLVDVKFDQGLDTRTQPKLVIPSKWTQLNNVSVSKDTTPQRRDAITSLVAPPLGNGNSLATYNNELVAINGPSAGSVSVANGVPFVNPIQGIVGNVLVGKSEIHRSNGIQDSVDCASGLGWTLIIWRDETPGGSFNGISYTLIDDTTGTKVIASAKLTALTTTSGPRVVFSGGAFYMFYIDSASTALYATVIDVTAPTTVGATVALVTDVNIRKSNFDAIEFGIQLNVTSAALVVFRLAGASTTSVKSLMVVRTGTVPSNLHGPNTVFLEADVPAATITAVTAVRFTTTICGCFVSTTGAGPGISGATFDQFCVLLTPYTHLDGYTTTNESHICGVLVGGNVQLFADNQGAYNSTQSLTAIRTVTVSSVLAVVLVGSNIIEGAVFRSNATEAAGPQGPFIHGKPFTTGTTPLTVFLPTAVMETWNGTIAGGNVVTVSNQSTFFLYNCTTAQVVAKALYGAYGPPCSVGNTPKVGTAISAPLMTSPATYAMPCYERTQLSLVNVQTDPVTGSVTGAFNISNAGICLLTLTVNTSIPQDRLQLGPSTYIAGGDLVMYDGEEIVEQGFPLYPEGINVTNTTGGTGTVTSGVHWVTALYEWIDGTGQRHQSAPSVPVSTTVAGTNDGTITVVIPTLLMSQKTNISIVLFMTQAGGLTFNRVTPLTIPIPNTTLAAFVSTTIAAADADIIGNELMYTQPFQPGTTLENTAPGPSSVIVSHQNRIFFDKADQPGQYGFSQQLVKGTGLQFNEQLGGSVDVSSGSLVGFEAMDDKMVIFCSNKLFYIYGTGPDGSGGFSNYSLPQEIPSDVGCSAATSVLQMPQGLIFKSLKGWYLLDRGLGVSFIGEGVSAYDANPVSSAVMLKDRQECRFASSSGTQLIYSYLPAPDGRGQWSTYDVQGGTYAIADAIYWATTGRYVSISLTEGLNTDNPTTFLDTPGSRSAATIITTMRTSWLHLGQLNGFERIHWLYLTGTTPQVSGTVLDSFKITVDYDNAYNGVAPGAYNFTTTNVPLVAGMPFDLRSKLRRQKCKAVAFTFTDTPNASQAAGINFQALTLELGMKRGTNKLAATQSKG